MTLGFGSNAKRWSLLVAIALIISACSTPEAPVADSEPLAPPVAVNVGPTVEELTAGLPRLDGSATVEIKVGSDVITVELDGSKAPYTAGNFVDLAQKGIYDGTIFHRVVTSPDPFVAQGGDPQSKNPNIPTSQLGTGGYIDPATGRPREIPLEILPADADEPVYGKTFPEAQITGAPELNHRRGAIAMARSGVNTASAQFYITLADLAFLDGNYAVFGYVTDGMDTVDNIQLGDVIGSVTVTAGADNLVQPEGAATEAEPAE
ncbi:MAG: peptidylprolyl isomerase [Cyanobacteria bacterium J06643_4]